MKNSFIVLTALIAFSCSSTDSKNRNAESDDNIVKEYYGNGILKTEISVKDSLRDGPTKNYDNQGRLLSEVNYINNVKEGTVTNYYAESGKVSSVFEYRAGVKQGDEIWYYENGKEYRITPYVDGKMNGVQKYYYETGELMAEVPYYNNWPGKGLKEYNKDGSLVTGYPTIAISKEDHLANANSVLLKFSLSDKSTDVVFYRGKLYQGIYLSDELSTMATQNGMTQISFNLPKGARVDQNVDIVANYKTKYGIPCILTTTYRLQIYNTF
jgi:antitoxin component YwqK of YwqJK toxin-antitoxin module